MAVDVHAHASEIVEDLKLVPERIVDDRQARYERWDRLNAEGEFRQALVPPLAAGILVLMERSVSDWRWALASTVPILALLVQGTNKINAAEAQLMQTVEAGAVEIAPVDKLADADLHWNR
jgi:hypothetical protein